MPPILPDIVSIGIYDSQTAVRNREITKNRKTTMFEIEIPLKKGGISYIDDEEMPIEPDLIICAKPGQMRHTRVPFQCYYIHMVVKEGMLYDRLMSLPNFMKVEQSQPYHAILEKLCQYYTTALSTDEIMIHSLILELVYRLYSQSQKLTLQRQGKNNNHEVIEKVMAMIAENLTADLSLETVARYAGFSPIHFHQCFKASTGQTLGKYVEEQRIKKAANLLVTTRKTLTEIAYLCGFSSQSYFSFAFKRKMSLTPREYAMKMFRQYEKGDEK